MAPSCSFIRQFQRTALMAQPPVSYPDLALHAVPSARAVFERVTALLSEKFQVVVADVHWKSRLVEDLGVDSLDLEYFALALEAEFGVDISNREATSLLTVLDAVECVLHSYKL